jgi:hypothetical protein
MILTTTDKLRSRHKAVLKAPACPQEIPGTELSSNTSQILSSLGGMPINMSTAMFNEKSYSMITEGQTCQKIPLGQRRDSNAGPGQSRWNSPCSSSHVERGLPKIASQLKRLHENLTL